MSDSMSSISQQNKQWLLILGTVLLTACATINQKHPQLMTGDLTEAQKAQVASVYFIRPEPLKTKGVSNNPVHITYQGEILITQGEGNYSLLYIKPSKGLLKIHSETIYTDQRLPMDVWRDREYKFLAGKTYFIYVRQINEEFRGVFYEPQPVSLREAKLLIKSGRGFTGSGIKGDTFATGAARYAPIDELTEVNVPPASAIKKLTPALPENIHKPEKYLREVK